ncbi:hypothetical protein EOD39_5506 [Acipenser ruthenus]|uniref:Uncharacterized protein n=1 Tax=Acipenser ruthenus TaxID=7906 RepID=A0A444UDW0_ACIRT|nr:hypothetical protein EOD39_5506 [Acipenser ruthenus]
MQGWFLLITLEQTLLARHLKQEGREKERRGDEEGEREKEEGMKRERERAGQVIREPPSFVHAVCSVSPDTPAQAPSEQGSSRDRLGGQPEA